RTKPPSRHGCRLEEVGHRQTRSGCAQTGGVQSKRVREGPQDAGVIVCVVVVQGVADRGLVGHLADWADQNCLDLPAAALPNRGSRAAGAARLVVLIKSDDQQAVASRLEIAASQ